MACAHVIGFREGIVRRGWEGRGFGRRFIVDHKCPKCGAIHHRIVNAWRGREPDMSVPGGFTCGAQSDAERYVAEGLGESSDFCPSDNG